MAWAAEQEGRYELHAGTVYAMAPERAGRARTKYSVQSELDRAISQAGLPCHMLPDGMTVHADSGSYEPDALVYCGPRVDDDVVVIDNPSILVEVLSPSTRHIDAAAKLISYFQLPSLQHYLIAESDKKFVIHHSRQADGSILTGIAGTGPLRLDPPGMEVSVDSFFR